MIAQRVAAFSGEPLDSLVWRSIGGGAGTVEAVLEANPGLAELGPALPEGKIVVVPLPASPAPEAPTVQLWS